MNPSIPERDLTPNELRQLIESNARAIAATSDLITQNTLETNQTINQLAQATASDIQQLASFMQEFFRHQGFTNRHMQDGLEEHQIRLDRIDAQVDAQG